MGKTFINGYLINLGLVKMDKQKGPEFTFLSSSFFLLSFSAIVDIDYPYVSTKDRSPFPALFLPFFTLFPFLFPLVVAYTPSSPISVG